MSSRPAAAGIAAYKAGYRAAIHPVPVITLGNPTQTGGVHIDHHDHTHLNGEAVPDYNAAWARHLNDRENAIRQAVSEAVSASGGTPTAGITEAAFQAIQDADIRCIEAQERTYDEICDATLVG